MPVHIALMRGINVGGNHILPMKDLRAMFEDAGATAVRTYIQSGNVIFEAPARAATALVRNVTTRVEDERGFGVPVVLRSASQLDAVLEANPFPKAAAEPKFLHVAFADRKPTAAAAAKLDPDRSPPDRFQVQGREIYLHYPGGAARSKLTVDYLERTLAVTVTIRNWRTTTKLRDLAAG
ncbi:MAG: DUF1697 domain-containing protein [Deltaproteobacteria bacterium]|nr:DUF1697 domain-containing protein [Deltaproteobacteria bacterium]